MLIQFENENLKLNKNLWKNRRIIALNKETTQIKAINDLLEKAIEKEDKIFKKIQN